jgi:predicted dehydrogenase
MANGLSRRHFFYGALLAGAVPAGGFGSEPSLTYLGFKSPNEKLNVASIGAGGKAASDIDGCATENIVALCDVDELQAAATFKKYPKPAKHRDYRRMLDRQAGEIDAVIVTVPDHMHATAALACMERGKHVYVQKPMAQTVWEARALTEAARKYKVATQMGNQGYAREGSRVCAEMIWSGAIGDVTEVHAWTNRPIWPQGLTEVPPAEPTPSTLDWDLWLGHADDRPYASGGAAYANDPYLGHFYQPFNWRGFFDFGCGALGDMACHVLGAVNMALMLGAPPISVECTKIEGASPFQFPKRSVTRFEFPARGSMPPFALTWYDACAAPPFFPPGVPASEPLGDIPSAPRPRGAAAPAPGGPDPNSPQGIAARVAAAIAAGRQSAVSGALFCGSKGCMTTGEYGDDARLVPAAKMADYKYPPQSLSRSPGTYRDWIRACKGGDPACSNFDVAGPFTEWIVMGVVALHFPNRKLLWDAEKMRFTNVPEANNYLKPRFRKGWAMNFRL